MSNHHFLILKQKHPKNNKEAISRIIKCSLFTLGIIILSACGGGGSDDSSSSDNDNNTTTNTAPVASAGIDLAVAVNQLVNLSAANSSDADGDSLSYQWTINSLPDGSTITLSDNSISKPNFIADIAGEYEFSLVVNDGTVDSSADVVMVIATLSNTIPVAQAGTDQEVTTGDQVTINGSQSSDEDDDTLTYAWTMASQPSGSSTTLEQSTQVSATFTADVDGDYTVALIVNDGSSDSTADTMMITASAAINNAPVAASDSLNTDEDTPISLTLSATDSESETLSYNVITPPTKGQLTLNSNQVDYVPYPNETGEDSFNFKVNDGNQDSNTATITLTINPVNDNPIAHDYNLSTLTDTAVDITLRSDDSDSDNLSYSLVSQPTNGSVTLDAGIATYTPSTSYTGSDNFTFRANDSEEQSNIATVTIKTDITENIAPTVDDDTVVASEDNDTDIDLSGITTAGRSNKQSIADLTYFIVTHPLNGKITIEGSIARFTPNGNYSGPDNFTFKSFDGSDDSNIGKITLTVSALNDAPIAQDFSVSTIENSTVSFNISATDTEFDSLTYFIVNDASHGDIVLTGSVVTYTPTNDYNGEDSFTFKANDGTSDSNSATVSLMVTTVANNKPEAMDITTSTPEDMAIEINLDATDRDGNDLTYSLVTSPSNGSISLSGSMAIYTPDSDYIGSDSFSYKANDGISDSNTAVVSIFVESVNDAPVASDITVELEENITTNIILTANDTEGDELTYSIATGPTFGSITLTETTATYTPETNYSGSDSFTFIANDGTSDSNSATVSLMVTTVANNSPEAMDITTSTPEDMAIEINLDAADSDGNDLTYSLVSSPSNGSISLSSSMAIYTPDSDYIGNDSFSYKANDGISDSNTAIVSIFVESVNDAPVASDITVELEENITTNIILTANDTEGDELTYSIATGPSFGSITLTETTATYTPESNYSGSDSFTFIANDGSDDSNIGTVSISITAISTAPVVENITVTTLEDIPVVINLSEENDDDGNLTYSMASDNGPTNGTVLISGSSVTFTPAENTNETGYFTYFAIDGDNYSNIGEITIEITPVNDAPIANDSAETTNESDFIELTLTATDVDNDNLIYSIVSHPTNGSLEYDGATVYYFPTANFTGNDNFTFKVNDGVEDSNTATVTITVNSSNNAPIANAGTNIHINVDNEVSLDGSNSTDEDNETLTYSWSIENAPSGSIAILSDSSVVSPTFTADVAGNYTFNLVVNDGIEDSNSGTVYIIAAQWQTNPNAERSLYIFDDTTNLGTEVNVQSITDRTNSDNESMIEVSASGIPNYQVTLTQDDIDALNSRPQASSDFKNSNGVTTATAGQTIGFGEDIGFEIRGQGCDLGYWPSGPSCPSDQSKVKSLPIKPEVASEECTSGGLGMIGYMLNGTAVYSWSDGASFNGEQVWSNNAPKFELYDLDVCLGHAQSSGDYHHHMFSSCLMTLFNDDGTEHSPVYGYAADGYPIYGPYHASDVLAKSAWVARDYDDVSSSSGCEIVGERSCQLVDNYDLSQGTVSVTSGPTTDEIVSSNSGNEFTTTSGFYYEDYYYDSSLTDLGGEYLDDHNGHSHGDYGYHYHTTVTEVDGNLEASFPYNIGPTFYGRLANSGIQVCK